MIPLLEFDFDVVHHEGSSGGVSLDVDALAGISAPDTDGVGAEGNLRTIDGLYVLHFDFDDFGRVERRLGNLLDAAQRLGAGSDDHVLFCLYVGGDAEGNYGAYGDFPGIEVGGRLEVDDGTCGECCLALGEDWQRVGVGLEAGNFGGGGGDFRAGGEGEGKSGKEEEGEEANHDDMILEVIVVIGMGEF